MLSNSETLIALAERVEAATGADRELDARIWCEVGNKLGFDDPPQKHRLMRPLQPRICVMGRWLGSALDKYPEDAEGVAYNWRVPRLTSSLDAAVSLVPAGWGWMVSQPNEKAIASGLLKARTPVRGEVQYGCDQRFAVAGATPALALTAAALRALAQGQTDE